MHKRNLLALKFLTVLLLTTLFITTGYSNDDNSSDHSQQHHGFDLKLKKGERAFYGLLQSQLKQPACVSCHNVVAIDTFNWNPSALDLAKVYKDKSASELAAVLNEPSSNVLSIKHEGINLSDEEVLAIKHYMDTFAEKNEALPEKPVIDNLIIFIGLILLLILAIIDLAFTKKIPFKAVHLVVILFALIYNTNTIVHEAINLGRQQNYQPDQPIKFSHQVHAGDNQIDCQYCHNTVEQSKSASIPSTNVCMNCHMLVNEGSNSGKWEIAKIHQAMETETPVEWIKVHNLPDHVFFSHAQHVGAAGLDCNQCHGEVEEMTEIKQVNDLSMGWCVNCHRTTEVAFTSNAFYDKYTELHQKLKTGEIDKVTAAMTGGLDCMKCHY